MSKGSFPSWLDDVGLLGGWLFCSQTLARGLPPWLSEGEREGVMSLEQMFLKLNRHTTSPPF